MHDSASANSSTDSVPARTGIEFIAQVQWDVGLAQHDCSGGFEPLRFIPKGTMVVKPDEAGEKRRSPEIHHPGAGRRGDGSGAAHGLDAAVRHDKRADFDGRALVTSQQRRAFIGDRSRLRLGGRKDTKGNKGHRGKTEGPGE